ncbi:glycosyltransferase family 39 protein [Micromonospora sp. NPDC049559]|uniref:glycosyltransferase family 39 protein n=1 Tax=Micromonospora sp. NPDC049559 TaxID=3155923 RepID=UPI00344578FD
MTVRRGLRPRGRLSALTALVALVVLAGAALRFLATSPLWLDEAQSVAISALPPARLVDALRADAAPPLYYLLLHGWMRLFGDGDLAVRGLSGLFAVAALPLFHRLARPYGAGTVTLALAAANPWLVRYATEARPYALEVLLVLLGVLALERAYRRPGPARAAALALVSALLLLTHYWSLFLYAATGAGLLVALRRPGRAAPAWCLVGLAAGAVPFLAWLPVFWYQSRHTGTPWAGRSGIQVLPNLIADWFASGVAPARVLLLVVWPLIVWAAVSGGRRTRLLGAAGAATLLLAYVAAWLTGSALAGRYTAVVVPFALLLLGTGAALLPRVWTVVLVGGLVATGLATDAVLVTKQRTEAGAVAAVLDRRLTDADTLVFCPDQLGPDVVRRLHTHPRLVSFPHQDDPGRLDWTDYARRIEAEDPARLADRLAAERGSGAVWLIPRYGYRPFGDRCERLAAGLRAALGPERQIPVRGPEGWEMLWHWPAD